MEFDPKVMGRIRTETELYLKGLSGTGLKIQQHDACQPCPQPWVPPPPSERGDLGIGWEYS